MLVWTGSTSMSLLEQERTILIELTSDLMEHTYWTNAFCIKIDFTNWHDRKRFKRETRIQFEFGFSYGELSYGGAELFSKII